MKKFRKWYTLLLYLLRSVWIKLGWRKAALSGVILLSLLVFGLVMLRAESGTSQQHQQNADQAAQAENTSAQTQTNTDVSSTNPSETSDPNTPKSTTPKPKNQTQTPVTPAISLNFSASEITVHAGWESSNFTASISNGKEFSGLSKEWNDNSPVSIAHPLGTKAGKTVTFFVSAPLNTNPGTYTVKVRASDGSESYTASLKVRVLPPLVAFDSITYDDDLEGYIILLNIHENFTGNPVVQLTSSPNGTPCSGNQFFIDQIDEETYTFECLYGLSGTAGSFPLTFSVSGAGKTWTKSVTWIR